MKKTVYLGRQPILDLKKNTYAYEILYRSGQEDNQFSAINGTIATSQVLYNLFYGLNFQDIVGDKKAFINFTKDNLMQDLPEGIVPSQVVIEVLEDVDVDSNVLVACEELKKKGFKIALDDFFIKNGVSDLLKTADIVKVDWLNTNPSEIEDLTRYLTDFKVTLLAEKVEKEEEFIRAVQLGYRYFQGFFFERPTIISAEDVAPSKWTYLRLFTLIQRPELEPKDISDIIKHDPALTFKLLKLINSAAFGLSQQVQSIEQAIVLLGEKEIRRWLSLIIMANLSADQPEELLMAASTRARFGELVAMKIKREDLAPLVFLMGIMSLLNTMMGRPMKEIMNKVRVHPSVQQALVNRSGPLLPFLLLMIAYERANHDALKKCEAYFKLSVEQFTQCYLEAVKWTTSIRDMRNY